MRSVKEAKGEYGVVGPGRMRGNLARYAPEEEDMRVVGFTRGSPVRAHLGRARGGPLPGRPQGPVVSPRSVFSYIPAGSAVDEILDDLAEGLDKDVLGDGGTVFYPGFEAGGG